MTTESQPRNDATPAQAAQTVLRSGDVASTLRLGERFGRLLLPGDVVLLDGDLGAGKTVFTQGIGRGLGIAQTINSPTFTLLKEYEGRIPLYHFDLYRIDDPDELLALGFDRYFEGDGVCVVEWAERGEVTGSADTPWPPDALRIRLRRDGPHGRVLICSASGPRSRAVLAEVARAVAPGPAE